MAKYSPTKIKRHLSSLNSGKNSVEKGDALENLSCYLIEKLPGVKIHGKKMFDHFHNQEFDLVLWNNPNLSGLYFLLSIIVVECKNHSRRADGMELSWLVDKMRNTGIEYAIFVTQNGVTGNEYGTKGAQSVIRRALLRDRIKILTITTKEIENLVDTGQLVELLKEKYRKLILPTPKLI